MSTSESPEFKKTYKGNERKVDACGASGGTGGMSPHPFPLINADERIIQQNLSRTYRGNKCKVNAGGGGGRGPLMNVVFKRLGLAGMKGLHTGGTKANSTPVVVVDVSF